MISTWGDGDTAIESVKRLNSFRMLSRMIHVSGATSTAEEASCANSRFRVGFDLYNDVPTCRVALAQPGKRRGREGSPPAVAGVPT